MRRSIATPCPVGPAQLRNFDDTFSEDTTANIEYTTAFQASFRQVKPRRGPVARHGAANFSIHEDKEAGRSVDSGGAVTKLAGPARRAVPTVNTQRGLVNAKSTEGEGRRRQDTQHGRPQRPAGALRRPAARISTILEVAKEESQMDFSLQLQAPVVQDIDRPRRRKTLYVPPDDTTQPTMWMGIFSPVKNEIVHGTHGEQAAEMTGIAAQMAERRKPRVSIGPARAKRVPLQRNETVQETAQPQGDKVGDSTGKENVPPGHKYLTKKVKEERPGPAVRRQVGVVDRDAQRKQFLAQARQEQLSRSRQKSPRSSPEVAMMYEIAPKVEGREDEHVKKRVAWNAGPRPAIKEDRPVRTSSSKLSTSPPSKSQYPPSPKVPTRFVRPVLFTQPEALPQIPITEHIENPAMYEEDWLSHQETIITQLLNSLFEQSKLKKQQLSPGHLRKELVECYNTPDISLLHSRLQAAILYGSLSLTQEAMFSLQGLVNDVGRRKEFLKFWLDNYESAALRAGLEIVTGKQVPTQNVRRSGGSSPGGVLMRQALARFIEAFLLRNEDIGFKPAGSGAVNDLGGRTILRCLMLVKALDLLQQTSAMANRCLFRRSAAFKSSVVAAQTLMRMLNPAVGDSIRALRQLGYDVCYEQEPMQEVEYNVENIAVDLRDGVVLTRLVELLLYKSASRDLRKANDNETHTVCMPEGETLLIESGDTWPLSQHLKLPCISRATKLWNMQIALGALGNVRSVNKLIGHVTAEDIVDGYREKTIRLLWALVGQYGLFGIVDWVDLRHEIRRLNPAAAEDYDFDAPDDEESAQAQCEQLLKTWTRAVAASKGQVVRNFTTSFSDGMVFKAILDEHEPYLIDHDLHKPQTQTQTLQQRLLRLGCSKQFSELFSSARGQTHIFGKDFVLAALAFLCSRVVGPSKLCRKTVVIQRCWRGYWEKVVASRQAVKRDLAVAAARAVGLRSGSGSGDDGDTKGDGRDLVSDVEARTEIERDIWLSL